MKWFHPLTESTIELCLGEFERSAAHSGGGRSVHKATSDSGHRSGLMCFITADRVQKHKQQQVQDKTFCAAADTSALHGYSVPSKPAGEF